jgi:hypothetical protein
VIVEAIPNLIMIHIAGDVQFVICLEILMKKLKSQPKIKGVIRIPKHSALHPHVWHGLNNISKSESRSLSWVIAEIISDYFGIDAATGVSHKRNIRRVK